MTTQEFLANCPPVGGTKKYLVKMDGKPMASFDTEREAQIVRSMYARETHLKKGGLSFGCQRTWSVVLNDQ